MPNFEISFSLDPKAADYIDVLRGTATPEDFFRRAMEIGICQMIENTARMNLDYLIQSQTAAIGDFRVFRGQLFAVAPPKETPPEDADAKPTTEIKDPMMGLKPFGKPGS